MLPTREVISSSWVGDSKYFPPLRSSSWNSSDLLLSSLPVLCQSSSDENVESESFDAPSLTMCLSSSRSTFSWTRNPKGRNWKRPECAWWYYWVMWQSLEGKYVPDARSPPWLVKSANPLVVAPVAAVFYSTNFLNFYLLLPVRCHLSASKLMKVSVFHRSELC